MCGIWEPLVVIFSIGLIKKMKKYETKKLLRLEDF